MYYAAIDVLFPNDILFFLLKMRIIARADTFS